MKKILQSPITLFISMALGILAGLYLTIIVPFLEPLNNIYISFMQVCSLPIIICTITINIGKIFQRSFHSVLKKWLVSAFIVMLLSSAIGIFVSAGMVNFLTPSDETKIALSKASDNNNEKEITDSFSELKIYDDNDISNKSEFSIIEFLVDLFPQNIFSALSENSTLQVISFFIIFGVMLTLIEKKYSVPIINLFEGINRALYKFINILLLLLPVSVFIMMASLFSNKNMFSILNSLLNFIIVNYVAAIIFIILSFIIITVNSKNSFKQHLHAIKRTFFVAIGTSSRSAAVPVVIEDSIKEMNIDETTVNFVIPIGTIFCPNGKILSSTILAIYALVIYGNSTSINTLFIIIMGSILYSISISGAHGVAAVTMLSIMLQPLGIPTDVMSIILMFSVQFYQGISTFAGVYSNLAVAFLVSPKNRFKNKTKNTSQIIEVAAKNVN